MLTADLTICITALLLKDATRATARSVLLKDLPTSVGAVGHTTSASPGAFFRKSRHPTNVNVLSDLSKQSFTLLFLWQRFPTWFSFDF